ncbi:MAG: TM1266 family iron-only hydrogenase system putative regulator [Spirochaetales bacterium]
MYRIAVVAIIIEDKSQSETINKILSNYGDFIIGRMGLPYKKRQLNIISVMLDAPNEIINAVAGKLGAVKGVSTKTVYSKEFPDE